MEVNKAFLLVSTTLAKVVLFTNSQTLLLSLSLFQNNFVAALIIRLFMLSLDAAVFDMEYGRWLEEHHRLMCELRAAVQEHLPENELRIFVDNCLAHYEQMINLKSMVAKSDVFHIVSGMWKTPAERCFMWMGGFRPSEIIKVLIYQLTHYTRYFLVIVICWLFCLIGTRPNTHAYID